jgi:hypothetical protein
MAYKAYYKFNSGALTTDSSGNAQTWTQTGTVTAVPAVVGTGADTGTTGTNGFTRTSITGINPNTKMTLSYIVRYTSNTTSSNFVFDIRTANNYFICRHGSNKMDMNMGNFVNSNTTFALGKFYHIAIPVTTSNIYSLYVNGVLDKTTQGSVNAGQSPSVSLMYSSATASNTAYGVMDEAIFDSETWNAQFVKTKYMAYRGIF